MKPNSVWGISQSHIQPDDERRAASANGYRHLPFVDL